MAGQKRKETIEIATRSAVSLSERVALGVAVGAIALFGIAVVSLVLFGTQGQRPQPAEPIVTDRHSVEIFTRDDVVVGLTDDNVIDGLASYLAARSHAQPGDFVLEKSVGSIQSKRFLTYTQTYHGLPVEDARSVALVERGAVRFLKTDYFALGDLAVSPKVSTDDALHAVRAALVGIGQEGAFLDSAPTVPESSGSLRRATPNETTDITGTSRTYDSATLDSLAGTGEAESIQLVIYPYGTPALAYRVIMPSTKNQPTRFVAYVDAQTGTVLALTDVLMHYAVSGSVTGPVWQDPYPTGGHPTLPFAKNSFTIGPFPVETSPTGAYTQSGLNGTNVLNANLHGPWVTVANVQQPPAAHGFTFTGPATHNWNWTTDDGSYLDEESNVFAQANRIHDYVVSLGVTEMNYVVPANVNINMHCNAYFDPFDRSINFYEAGDGCESTGVISDVVVHEYGHGIVHQLDPSLPYFYGESGNIHEALADYWACTLNDNPIVGEGFHVGDPSGIRICNSTDRYPEDYNPEPHTGAQIVSGALWDVRTALGKSVADPMLVEALRLQPENFREFLEALLVADDTNGNLGDGTPHINQICGSFSDGHGISSPYCVGHTSQPMAYVTTPPPADFIARAGTTLTINGTATGALGNDFTRYVLEWGRGATPTLWATSGVTLTNGGMSEVYDNTLGQWNSSVATQADYYTLRLIVTAGTLQTTRTVTLYLDPTIKSGWPVTIPGEYDGQYSDYFAPGPFNPQVSDLNKDGHGEVVFTTPGPRMKLNVLRDDGTTMAGWPVTLPSAGYYGVPNGNLPTPTIGDLDADGDGEMLIVNPGIDRRLYAYHHSGQLVTGFPVQLPVQTDLTSILLHDLNQDGWPEIVVAAHGQASLALMVYTRSGQLMPGWPVSLEENPVSIYTYPAVGNLDTDADLELVVAYNRGGEFGQGYVDVFNLNGTRVNGWPVTRNAIIFNTPAVGDLDADGSQEVVVGYRRNEGVFVYDRNGFVKPGWPQLVGKKLTASPALLDVGADHTLEIAVSEYSTSTGYTHLLSRFGEELPNWPQAKPYIPEWYSVSFTSAAVSADVNGRRQLFDIAGKRLYGWDESGGNLAAFPKIAGGMTEYALSAGDIDADGKLELLTGSTIDFLTHTPPLANLILWDTEIRNAPAAEWPGYLRDPQHTSLFQGQNLPYAILAADDFNDGDANGWTTNGGTWNVATADELSPFYREISATGFGKHAFRTGQSWSAQNVLTVRSRMRHTGTANTVGITAYTDRGAPDESYRLDFNRSTGKLQIIENGQMRAETAFTMTYADWYVFKLSFEKFGSQLKVVAKAWRELAGESGAATLQFTDASPLPAGSAGLYCFRATQCRFDDFLVTQETATGGGSPVFLKEQAPFDAGTMD